MSIQGEMEKGDVPKSIHCYMRESGCSEEEAREYVKQLIDEVLKRMNKEILIERMGVNLGFCAASMNLSRIAHCVYQFGDGFGDPHRHTREILVSLIAEPIPFMP